VDRLGLAAEALDAVIRDGVPTMVYQDWAGTGAGYLWNAVAGGKRKQWDQSPDAGELARNFRQENGVWQLRPPEERREAYLAEAFKAIPGKMEEIGPALEGMAVGGGAIGALPAFAVAGSLETGAALHVYGGQALGSIWARGVLALAGTQSAYQLATDEEARADAVGTILSDPNGVRATGELLGAGVSGLAKTAANFQMPEILWPSYRGQPGFAPGMVRNPFGFANTVPAGQKLLGYTGKLADHHIMPRQFEKFFGARGINIDEFTVSVDHAVTHLKAIHGRGNMGQMPGRWNTVWGDWIKANPNATATEIYQQAGRMMDDFGINHLKIHPYGN